MGISRSTPLERRVFRTGAAADLFVQAELEARLANAGFTERDRFGIRLACHEALSNALYHGNGGDAQKAVDVRFRIDEHGFFIRIEDEGAGFDPAAVPDPRLPETLERATGRGLLLMRHYMDRVWFPTEHGGRVVLMARAKRP